MQASEYDLPFYLMCQRQWFIVFISHGSILLMGSSAVKHVCHLWLHLNTCVIIFLHKRMHKRHSQQVLAPYFISISNKGDGSAREKRCTCTVKSKSLSRFCLHHPTSQSVSMSCCFSMLEASNTRSQLLLRPWAGAANRRTCVHVCMCVSARILEIAGFLRVQQRLLLHRSTHTHRARLIKKTGHQQKRGESRPPGLEPGPPFVEGWFLLHLHLAI